MLKYTGQFTEYWDEQKYIFKSGNVANNQQGLISLHVHLNYTEITFYSNEEADWLQQRVSNPFLNNSIIRKNREKQWRQLVV